MKKIALQLAIIILLAACQEEPEAPTLPASFELTMPEVTEIGLYSAHAEAQITFGEVEEIKNTDFGLVWSTSSGAVPSDSVQQSWSTRGVAAISRSPFPIYDVLSDLELNTTYYIRPYFVDEKSELMYGSETTFTTLAGDAWGSVGNFPGSTGQWPVGFAIDEAIYVGLNLVHEGGNTSVTREWWQYDVVTQQWTQKADFPGEASIQPATFATDGKGYIVSGLYEQYVECWEYDPQEDRWTRKTDFPDYGREGNAAFSFGINGKGYLSGGYGGSYSYKSVWEFDPQDATDGTDEHGNPIGSWTQKNDFPGREHRDAAVFIIGDQVYIGLDAETVVSTGSLEIKKQLWRYDASNDSWTAEGFFPGEPREQTIAFSANGKGYMGGGSTHFDFWEYDPVTKEWTPKAETGGADISFSVNNRGYAFSYGMSEYVP